MTPYIISGLVVGSIYAISALGLVLTYTSSRVFNFAHGAIAYSIAVFYYYLTRQNGWSIATAAPFTLLVYAPLLGLALYLACSGGSRTPRRRCASCPPSVSGSRCRPRRRSSSPRPRRTSSTPRTHRARPMTPSSGCSVVGQREPVRGHRQHGGHRDRHDARPPVHARRPRHAMTVDHPRNAGIAGSTGSGDRRSWMVGVMLAGFAGVLLSPIVGLQEFQFTLLLVGSFAAVMIGRMTSLPLAFAGAIAVGLMQQIWVKYQPSEGSSRPAWPQASPSSSCSCSSSATASEEGLRTEAFEVDRRGTTARRRAPIPPPHGWSARSDPWSGARSPRFPCCSTTLDLRHVSLGVFTQVGSPSSSSRTPSSPAKVASSRSTRSPRGDRRVRGGWPRRRSRLAGLAHHPRRCLRLDAVRPPGRAPEPAYR